MVQNKHIDAKLDFFHDEIAHSSTHYDVSKWLKATPKSEPSELNAFRRRSINEMRD